MENSNDTVKTVSLIPIGTQIVTITQAKVISENRTQPRGAVGVIVWQPQDTTHSYIVEFADASRSALKRGEFAVRKEYQTEAAADSSAETDYDKFIIYRCVVGSRAFGLDDEDSDTDLRGIYLPPAPLHWSLRGVPEQLENKENEECYWELQKFLTLALKANPNILECLNTPLVEYANDLAQELLAMKEIFFSRLVYQTYSGYVLSQFKKLDADLRNQGAIRWKHAMHLIRLLLQGIEILRAGELNVRVEKHRAELLAIKRGETSWEQINNWRLDLHKDFDAALATTKLPERPDYDRADAFLIGARRKMAEKF